MIGQLSYNFMPLLTKILGVVSKWKVFSAKKELLISGQRHGIFHLQSCHYHRECLQFLQRRLGSAAVDALFFDERIIARNKK